MAKRSGWDGSFLSPVDGLPMSGVQCTVYNSVGSAATIYETKTGGTLKANPFTTSSNGVLTFYADPGYYEIEVADTQIPARFTTRRIPFDAVAGDDEGVAGKQIDFTSADGNKIVAGDIKTRIHPLSGSGAGAGPNYVIAQQASIPAGTYILNGTVEAATANVGVDTTGGSASVFGHASPVDSVGVGQVWVLNYMIVVTSTTTVRIKGLGLGSEKAYGQLFGIDA